MSARFSSADAAWLRMDRPTNLMVINSVLAVRPAGRLGARQGGHPAAADRPLPALSPARGREPPAAASAARGRTIRTSRSSTTCTTSRCPRPGDTAALQELVSDLMTMPLDHHRPLWHIYMVDGFGDGAAMITRMHHCIADGVALARVMLSLTDSEPDAGIGPARPSAAARARACGSVGVPAPPQRALAGAGALRHGARCAPGRRARRPRPSHAASLAGAVGRDGATAARLLLTPADAATAIKGDPGISRRVAWTPPLSLTEIKRHRPPHDATVNDVLLAAVAGRCATTSRTTAARWPRSRRWCRSTCARWTSRFHASWETSSDLSSCRSRSARAAATGACVEVHHRMDEIKHGRDGAGVLRAAEPHRPGAGAGRAADHRPVLRAREPR